MKGIKEKIKEAEQLVEEIEPWINAGTGESRGCFR